VGGQHIGGRPSRSPPPAPAETKRLCAAPCMKKAETKTARMQSHREGNGGRLSRSCRHMQQPARGAPPPKMRMDVLDGGRSPRRPRDCRPPKPSPPKVIRVEPVCPDAHSAIIAARIDNGNVYPPRPERCATRPGRARPPNPVSTAPSKPLPRSAPGRRAVTKGDWSNS